MKKVIEYRILETNFNRKNQQIKIRTEKKTDARWRTRRGAEELPAAYLPAADAPYPRCFAGPPMCRSPTLPSRYAAGLQAATPPINN